MFQEMERIKSEEKVAADIFCTALENWKKGYRGMKGRINRAAIFRRIRGK